MIYYVPLLRLPLEVRSISVEFIVLEKDARKFVKRRNNNNNHDNDGKNVLQTI